MKLRADVFIVLGILATAGGCVAAYHLPNAWQNSETISQESKTLTLQELIAQRPKEKQHVVVTDFTCASAYAFELQVRKGAPAPKADQSGFGKAWIPLFPKTPTNNTDEGTLPRQFVVLLETTPTLASGAEFRLLSRKQSMEGIAMPLSKRPLNPESRRFLIEKYPNTDLENCVLLLQFEPREKEDASFLATLLAIGTGVGLLVGIASLSFGFFVLRRQKTTLRRGSSIDGLRP